MKFNLRIHKQGASYEDAYDIVDADSFGAACCHAWKEFREQRAKTASSIGALYDALDERHLDDLNGVVISLTKSRA